MRLAQQRPPQHPATALSKHTELFHYSNPTIRNHQLAYEKSWNAQKQHHACCGISMLAVNHRLVVMFQH